MGRKAAWEKAAMGRETLGEEGSVVQLQGSGANGANSCEEIALCFPPETFAATHQCLHQHIPVISVVVF